MMEETLTLTLVLSEKEPAELERIADAVSDPANPAYGQHRDRDTLREIVAIPTQEREDLLSWVASQGLEILVNPDAPEQLVFVRGTVSQVTKAFGEELLLWVNKEKANPGARIHYAIPRRFAGYVTKIGGMPGERGQMARILGDVEGAPSAEDTNEDGPSGGESAPAQGGERAPASGYSVEQLKKVYQFPEEWDGAGETIALLSLGGSFAEEDVKQFCYAQGVEPPEVYTRPIGRVDPRPAHPMHIFETTMTVQWLSALAPRARIVVYTADARVMGDPWSAFLLRLIQDREFSPTVGTISWVTGARQYYALHGTAFVDGLLNQLAALGITIVSASGDWGAFDGVPRRVVDGRYVSDAPWPHGVFPAVETRVLSVGGTMLTSLDPLTEIAWSGPLPPNVQNSAPFSALAGGGGFSEHIPIPSWQRSCLRAYYPRGVGQPAVLPYGRAFPDVGMVASGPAVQRALGEPLTPMALQALIGGKWIDYALGTSLGAPIWAAIIARMNQARRAKGLSRVGFVNPLLYRLAETDPEIFRSITQGSSDVTMNAVNDKGKAMSYRLSGYESRDGWNPVAGLGVPRVDRLVAAVQRSYAESPLDKERV